MSKQTKSTKSSNDKAIETQILNNARNSASTLLKMGSPAGGKIMNALKK